MQLATKLPDALQPSDFARYSVVDRYFSEAAQLIGELLKRVDKSKITVDLGRKKPEEFGFYANVRMRPEVAAELIRELLTLAK